MSGNILLGITLPLATFVVSAGLFFFALRKKWHHATVDGAVETEVVAEPEKETKEGFDLTQLKKYAKQYKWELLLGGVLLALFAFAWVYAPPRLLGELAISPSQPGRPFYNLRWGRDFIRLNYDFLWRSSGILFSLVALLLIPKSIKDRSLDLAGFVFFFATLNIAFLGQWFLFLDDFRILGRNLYLFAAWGFVFWAWGMREKLPSVLEKRPSRKNLEVLFLLGLLILTSFTRLYTLQTIPYGIEGDEAKWTSEAVNLGILGKPDSSGEYHRDALPVSFYLQTPLHRLIGPSLYAARLTVALLSILGTLLFYWLLRKITNFPLAALSSMLLGASIFDISASRLANVESFVKIAPILTLLLLAWAIESRRWQVYGLSGIALALGMLTYDTVWPLAVIALLLAIIELVRQKESLQEKAKNVAALLTPTILSLPLLIPYLSSRLQYYKFDEKGFETEAAVTFWGYFKNIFSTWFVAARPDFLYNRVGPLLNSVLLPFLVLGVVVAIVQFRKRASYWHLIWASLLIFPVPILANSPLGRVYYPALPAIFFFVGLGLLVFWQEMDRVLGKIFRPFFIAVTLLFLVWLPLSNLYIYFNEVLDPPDRQMRREIGEFAAQIADTETLLLLPATPGENTPLNNEYQMLELYLLQHIPKEQLDETYQYIAPENLLDEIIRQKENHPNIEILFDTAKTPKIGQMVEVCYPEGETTIGNYFTHVRLEREDLQNPDCLSASLVIDQKGENALGWQLENITTEEIRVSCENRRGSYQWIEAEDTQMSAGWQPETNFVTDWHGTGFVMDHYGSEVLVFRLQEPLPDGAYIWVRSYKRVVDRSPAYLSVGNEDHRIADIEIDDTDLWRWEKFGPINVDGEKEFFIRRPYKEDPETFMAIFIDSLVITTDAYFSPEDDLWEEVSPQRYSFDKPADHGLLTLDIPAGHYQCFASVETDLPIVEEDGGTTLYSDIIEIEIR